MKIEGRDNEEEREWLQNCPTFLDNILATRTVTGLVNLTQNRYLGEMASF